MGYIASFFIICSLIFIIMALYSLHKFAKESGDTTKTLLQEILAALMEEMEKDRKEK